MIYIGIFLIVVGLIALALDRNAPALHPVSTFVMYIGLGLGLILLIVGILGYTTQGSAIQVDSSGVVSIR